MSERVLHVLKEKFGDAVLETHSHLGDDTAVVDAKRWKEICAFLRNDPQMDMNLIVDLCGVDFPDREPRFEVVLHVYSIPKRHRLRLKARVGDAEGDGAEIDSVTDVWPGANWYERETFDLMGVTFKNHPDLRRILMYPEFVGHPLRKDYPKEKRQPLVRRAQQPETGD